MKVGFVVNLQNCNWKDGDDDEDDDDDGDVKTDGYGLRKEDEVVRALVSKLRCW